MPQKARTRTTVLAARIRTSVQQKVLCDVKLLHEQLAAVCAIQLVAHRQRFEDAFQVCDLLQIDYAGGQQDGCESGRVQVQRGVPAEIAAHEGRRRIAVRGHAQTVQDGGKTGDSADSACPPVHTYYAQ